MQDVVGVLAVVSGARPTIQPRTFPATHAAFSIDPRPVPDRVLDPVDVERHPGEDVGRLPLQLAAVVHVAENSPQHPFSLFIFASQRPARVAVARANFLIGPRRADVRLVHLLPPRVPAVRPRHHLQLSLLQLPVLGRGGVWLTGGRRPTEPDDGALAEVGAQVVEAVWEPDRSDERVEEERIFEVE